MSLTHRYVIYTQPSLDAPATVLLDPNTLSKDGTVALKVCVVVLLVCFHIVISVNVQWHVLQH